MDVYEKVSYGVFESLLSCMYGVIGILERIREPSEFAKTFSLPDFPPVACVLSDVGVGVSRTNRRNCELFILPAFKKARMWCEAAIVV